MRRRGQGSSTQRLNRFSRSNGHPNQPAISLDVELQSLSLQTERFSNEYRLLIPRTEAYVTVMFLHVERSLMFDDTIVIIRHLLRAVPNRQVIAIYNADVKPIFIPGEQRG